MQSKMQKSRILVVAGLVLALTATAADARRHGRHHHRYNFPKYTLDRVAPAPESYARATVEPREFNRRGSRDEMAALIPRDWQLEPPDPDWQGYRFVSPRGDARLEIYGRPVADQARGEQVKSVIFIGEREELTYLRGERNWIAASGFKGDSIFYRKAVLACGERQWRHIAFEYPAVSKSAFDRFVTAMSRALDRSVGKNCEASVDLREDNKQQP